MGNSPHSGGYLVRYCEQVPGLVLWPVDNIYRPVDKVRLTTGSIPLYYRYPVGRSKLSARTSAVEKGYILGQPSPVTLWVSLFQRRPSNEQPCM